MSTPLTAHPTSVAPATPQRIALLRAVVALLWAAAVVLAIGDDVPRTDSDVPAVAAVLLAGYPLVDVVASVLGAGAAAAADRVLLRVNAGIGVLAVLAIAVAAFGSDAGATLTAFGAWAALTGAIQLVVAVRRRAQGRQLPMILSGGISTVAGVSFIAAAGRTDANLAMLGGYMAFGAVLFLVWGLRARGR